MTTKIKIIKINKKILNNHIKNNTENCRICKHKFKINEMAISKYVACLGKIAKRGGYNHYRFSKVNEKGSRRVLYCLSCALEKNLIDIKSIKEVIK